MRGSTLAVTLRMEQVQAVDLTEDHSVENGVLLAEDHRGLLAAVQTAQIHYEAVVNENLRQARHSVTGQQADKPQESGTTSTVIQSRAQVQDTSAGSAILRCVA